MPIAYRPAVPRSLALFYLARGADDDHLASFRRFARAYRDLPAGVDHTLFVIFKGFRDAAHLEAGKAAFAELAYRPLHTDDESFDIGAYAAAAAQITHERVCCLNTHSEPLAAAWLGKLAANLDQPRVGLVGATGSFESLRPLDQRFPAFPNVHVRSNAFMIERTLLLSLLSGVRIRDKFDAFFAESGSWSITRQVFERGLSAAVVGRDGRGYTPTWWPVSQTFRQGMQANLMVADNATRDFERLPWSGKQDRCRRTWGRHLQPDIATLSPGRLYSVANQPSASPSLATDRFATPPKSSAAGPQMAGTAQPTDIQRTEST
ncbi:MAG TPA: hypothetical protein VJ890_27780 [Vineibacter sp.]|nr:hypothetical protein [Vineibacter sp.]